MFDVFSGPKNEQPFMYETLDTTRLEQRDIARAFARLFASDDGRVVLSHLQAMTFQRALMASAPDAELRYYEGQRGLVAQILRLIDRGRHE